MLLVKNKPDASQCCPVVASATGAPASGCPADLSAAPGACCPVNTAPEAVGATEQPAPAVEQAGLPRLLDLGAGTCIPCKKLAPILEELGEELKGRLIVEFIDIRENSEAADEYGIRTIPTQILFDANGRELARNEGFISKADILAWIEKNGIDLTATDTAPQE